MKHALVLSLISRLKASPRLKRNLIIFSVIGIIGFFTTAVLVIWLGLAAFSYAATKATAVIQSPQTSSQIETLRNETLELSNLNVFNCWNKAQSLMAAEPWVLNPVGVNFQNLKVACLQKPAQTQDQIPSLTPAPISQEKTI